MAPHLEAGRYAWFVWPAYGLSAAVVLGLVGESLARARRWRRSVERAARPPSGRSPSERST